MAASVDQVGGGGYSLCEVRWRVAYRWSFHVSGPALAGVGV